MNLDKKYWNQTYLDERTGWDIGYVSTPIKEYIDQLKNKDIKILIPGAGNAYEVEYLYNKGFKNTFLLEFADEAIHNFKKRTPAFPDSQIIYKDFFEHKGEYDLIIEQTFLTSFDKELRPKYAEHMYSLLKSRGKLVGLLFNHNFGNHYPPFGGTKAEYNSMFSDYFSFKTFELSYNSIKPRMGRELFINFLKNA